MGHGHSRPHKSRHFNVMKYPVALKWDGIFNDRKKVMSLTDKKKKSMLKIGYVL